MAELLGEIIAGLSEGETLVKMKAAANDGEKMVHKGVPGADGIAIGQAYVYKREETVIDREPVPPDMTGRESGKLAKGIAVTKGQVSALKESALARIGTAEAGIFDAHLLFLDDPAFTGEMARLIEDRHFAASLAVATVVEEYAALFAALEDEYMRERAADIRDVGTRLLHNVLGMAPAGLAGISEEVVIVAGDLTPSDTVMLNRKFVKGLAIGKGGRTSHAAIIARTLEIPAVLGLGDLAAQTENGDPVIIDGTAGIVIIRPDGEQTAHYQQQLKAYRAECARLTALSELPAVTSDGRKVELAANIGSPHDVAAVLRYNGEGVGLFRTEFLYMEQDALPGEEEQFAAYKAVAAGLAGKPVIIRTLDIGGDKELKCMGLTRETNPFLGWRAIRICLSRPDVFKTQLRAILRASAFGNVLIMYPMISGIREVREANAVLAEAKEELRREKAAFDEEIKVGVMIEIPSAALTADTIIREVDFFSIGTNDLCQYTLAVDRMNEKISHMYQPLHPGVLRLIKNVIDAAHQHGKPAGMCGELAGDPAAAIILLGLGLDEFSMSPAAIPQIKQVIRNVSYREAQEAARTALGMETPEEINEYAARLLAKTRQNG